ncbi:hypothetical protein IW262DRAFT_1453926 [Armillaria fumosa]|nr:hypothetical protein IW262DRAFT_1453926 [Armillaria fumosa]
MKIEWAADFHRDGSRRRHPIPNTMHGWLAKMRGTLMGDEKLRSKGMREMKAAREYKHVQTRRKKQPGGFFANLFGHKSRPSRTGSGTRGQPHSVMRRNDVIPQAYLEPPVEASLPERLLEAGGIPKDVAKPQVHVVFNRNAE